eukprot:6483718-Amphidinium_carterae.1
MESHSPQLSEVGAVGLQDAPAQFAAEATRQRCAAICNPADITAVKFMSHQPPPTDRHSQTWLDWRGNIVDSLAKTGAQPMLRSLHADSAAVYLEQLANWVGKLQEF